MRLCAPSQFFVYNLRKIGGNPQSAGRFKRAENERKLKEEIRGLLLAWKEDLESCDIIFTHIPGAYNFATFYGSPGEQKAVYPKENENIAKNDKLFLFWKKDERIKKIPITTHRVTLDEIRRVHRHLSAVWLNVDKP